MLMTCAPPVPSHSDGFGDPRVLELHIQLASIGRITRTGISLTLGAVALSRAGSPSVRPQCRLGRTRRQSVGC